MMQRKRVVAMSKGFNLSVTDFTQSLGEELLTNGDFAAWTSGDPDGWTEIGESGSNPEVTQVAAANTHGGGGTGAMNLYSGATASQPGVSQVVAAAAGDWVEFAMDVSARASGGVRLVDSTLAGLNVATISSVRTIKRTFQIANTTATIRCIGAAPHDLTGDNASLKKIAPNAAVNTVDNGTFDFLFTEAGTKYAQHMIGLQYNIQDEGNYFILYLARKIDNSDWDIYHARVVNNVPAVNTLLATGTGVVTGLRAIRSGSTHKLYTLAGDAYTQRGSDQTDANFASAIGLRAIYSPGTTPIELRAAA